MADWDDEFPNPDDIGKSDDSSVPPPITPSETEIIDRNFTGMGGGGAGEGSTLSTIILKPDKLHDIYLANSDPQTAFSRMINVLLDNYIYYVTFSGNAPLPSDSIYRAVDPLGLSGQFAEIVGEQGLSLIHI